MIITKHSAERMDELGNRSCFSLDSPSIQVAPMIIHQPRYSISNLVLYTSPSAILKSTLIIPEKRMKNAIIVSDPFWSNRETQILAPVAAVYRIDHAGILMRVSRQFDAEFFPCIGRRGIAEYITAG